MLHHAVAPDFKLDRANDDVGFIRRTLPAMAATLLAFTAIRMGFTYGGRRLLMSANDTAHLAEIPSRSAR